LFGAVYAEVPYVDLLKTALNRRLPLTAYEYHEFGNPAKGPVEFERTLRISPIHTLGPAGAPGVKVLCRSGYSDIQVYYYESLKWIYTLRGNREDDDTKILYINKQGHHTTGRELSLDLAEDFLVIEHWLLKGRTK
jgi:oligopeptidase B